jgi:hypothetical protein
MRRLAIVVVLLAACSGDGAAETTTTTMPTTTTTLSDTTTTSPPPDCPAAPYELTVLPVGVGDGEFDSTVEPDVWTSVAGTNTTFVPRSDDTVAIALIRGTLPAVEWPAEKGEVDIDGTRAVAGPHPDGAWVAGWFEEPGERCDQYTMVFYPPWNPSDVEQVLAGMNRVGG